MNLKFENELQNKFEIELKIELNMNLLWLREELGLRAVQVFHKCRPILVEFRVLISKTDLQRL